MSNNAKTVWVIAIGALVLSGAGFLASDVYKGRPRYVGCGDGQRYTIDVRQFETRYFAYSIELEASVKSGSQVSAKVSSVQLQTLTEAMQSANEFRKSVVAGFNSCAISKARYDTTITKFQSLDGLAREINELTAKPSLTQQENSKLAVLIEDYGQLAGSLGSN